MHRRTDGILESSLYVSDLLRSVRFYEDIFGFRVISEFGDRGCAMHAGTRQVLLLFKKGASRTIQSPTTATASYTSPSLSQLTNWATGNRGFIREESQWKRSASGNWEAGACTSETRTAIWSNSPRRAHGPSIKKLCR
jgi:Glyoxalase/Bleomycin resistance protein/Dioxygenase superfamily